MARYEAAHLCSHCAFATDDPWVMLFHRDTHTDDPEVKRRTAEMTALLASKPSALARGAGEA